MTRIGKGIGRGMRGVRVRLTLIGMFLVVMARVAGRVVVGGGIGTEIETGLGIEIEIEIETETREIGILISIAISLAAAEEEVVVVLAVEKPRKGGAAEVERETGRELAVRVSPQGVTTS